MIFRSFLSSKKFFYGCFAFTLLFLSFISFIYFRHATTFNFVDEYTNIVAGYFMLKGRYLYTDIFFHHQMFMPYISYMYQLLITPDSLYQLIVHHRIIVIAFAFILNIVLLLRFRYVGIGFVLFFEPLKYYLFGNLFLAESFIVYPIVYLLGLAWESWASKKIHKAELFLASLAVWFVIFTREPYVPLVLVLYGFLLWKNTPWKKNIAPIIFFTLLCLATLATVSFKDFFYQVVYINATYVIPQEVGGQNKMISIFTSFIYPLTILFESDWNFYRALVVALDIVFLSALGYLVSKKYSLYKILFFLIILGLANIRWVSSATNFYIAYHAIPWLGTFCFLLFLFIQELYKLHRKTATIFILTISIIFLVMMFYPKSYIWENPNRSESFTINYSKYYTNGIIINLLADEDDTVFIDYWDSLIYWQADRDSAYEYAMYYPVTSSVQHFVDKRMQMFQKSPPTFYFTDCKNKTATNLIPATVAPSYTQLQFAKKPTCLYILKKKVSELSEKQLEDIKALNYTIANIK